MVKALLSSDGGRIPSHCNPVRNIAMIVSPDYSAKYCGCYCLVIPHSPAGFRKKNPESFQTTDIRKKGSDH